MKNFIIRNHANLIIKYVKFKSMYISVYVDDG